MLPSVAPESLNPFPLPVLFALGILAVAAIVFLARHAEKARRAALAAFAESHQLTLLPGRNPEFARRFESLRGLNTGDNRSADNILTGSWRGQPVTAFDFRYETTSTDEKGNRQTERHHLHVLTLNLGRAFPALQVSPEGLLSKIAQAAGYDDIDFESHEFSRRFCVRSAKKRFAYDVCHALMIEFLLSRPDTAFQVSNDLLAIVSPGVLAPDRLAAELDLLVDLRERFPNYLFA